LLFDPDLGPWVFERYHPWPFVIRFPSDGSQNLKIPKLVPVGLFAHRYVFYPGKRRAFPAPGDHVLDAIFPSLENSLNRSVASISDPSVHPDPIGCALGFSPKIHTLNPSGNPDVNPFVFHDYFTLPP
jgi:hypothetical protein